MESRKKKKNERNWMQDIKWKVSLIRKYDTLADYQFECGFAIISSQNVHRMRTIIQIFDYQLSRFSTTRNSCMLSENKHLEFLSRRT